MVLRIGGRDAPPRVDGGGGPKEEEKAKGRRRPLFWKMKQRVVGSMIEIPTVVRQLLVWVRKHFLLNEDIGGGRFGLTLIVVLVVVAFLFPS